MYNTYVHSATLSHQNFLVRHSILTPNPKRWHFALFSVSILLLWSPSSPFPFLPYTYSMLEPHIFNISGSSSSAGQIPASAPTPSEKHVFFTEPIFSGLKSTKLNIKLLLSCRLTEVTFQNNYVQLCYSQWFGFGSTSYFQKCVSLLFKSVTFKVLKKIRIQSKLKLLKVPGTVQLSKSMSRTKLSAPAPPKNTGNPELKMRSLAIKKLVLGSKSDPKTDQVTANE